MTRAHQETGAREQGNLLQDLPEWLEDFTENLEIAELTATVHILMTQLRNVLSKWHHGSTIDLSHFPKDQNSEVCKNQNYKGTVQKANW